MFTGSRGFWFRVLLEPRPAGGTRIFGCSRGLGCGSCDGLQFFLFGCFRFSSCAFFTKYFTRDDSLGFGGVRVPMFECWWASQKGAYVSQGSPNTTPCWRAS